MSYKSDGDRLQAGLGGVEHSIKAKPLKALGLSAVAGFVVGGGYRSRLGISILFFLGRAAIREAAISAFARAVDEAADAADQHDGRSGNSRKRPRASTLGAASHPRAGKSKDPSNRHATNPA